MNTLKLRQVNALQGRVSREFGAGQRLGLRTRDQDAELTLLPPLTETAIPAAGVWFNSAVGALCLTDAEALLSLLGDAPLTLTGEHQAWYWQFFNQRLSPAIAALLAPVEPLLDNPATATVGCRLQVRRAGQTLHAHLHTTPDTLLRLLRSAPWQARQQPLDPALQVTTPLVIGELVLTLEQLSSLRPGDVVLPARCQFDSHGQGHLALAGRRWAVQATDRAQQLFLQLNHEEPPLDEH
ncbi:type III secretion system protein [Pseudomonas sp. Z1-12]|uniref:type III secretion system protein n=1 Tax=Pseudomonas sp. Z1-12 TaxID=2817408 RepID=UPI003DAA0776